ncbi:hypothetical protein Tco_1275845 [Tanacetum coccineum]
MHENKSFNRNPTNHALYHALIEALIDDENAMDKGVADTVKNHKRQLMMDDVMIDRRPLAGPYPGEPVEETTAKVVMDDAFNTAGKDVVRDDDQTQDTSEPKTNKTPNQDWFKQPPRPPTHICNIDLEYNFQECFNALTDKLDWNNPKGDHYPFDLSKPLPLQGRPGHLTVAVDYFFNNDLEYLKTSDPDLIWRKHTQHQSQRQKQLGDFVDLHLNDIEDMLASAIHTQDIHISTKVNFVDFIVALHMCTISLIIKFRVEDLQLGVESYQTKLNIITPQQTSPEIEFKELYTPSYKPPGGCNDKMPRRKWTAIDKKISELMVELINKQMRERRIIRNLKRLVGARELEMDYKLMT